MANATADKTKSVEKKPVNWAIFLSVISLSISAFNFYFANLRVAHSLKVILAPMYYDSYAGDTVNMHFKGIFQNYGNKTEAVLRSFSYFNSDSGDSLGYKIIDTSFIIKPGEIVMKDYHLSFSPTFYQKLSLKNKQYTTRMSFDLIEKNGYVETKTIEFAGFRMLPNGKFELINIQEVWHNKDLIKD